MNGVWFCETCDRAVADDLRAHEGHDLTHFSDEDYQRALRDFLPVEEKE